MNFYDSSSSEECDCYLCQVGMNCHGMRTTPFYPTMGQPLVYYADVPSNGRKHKRPNCFVRAFRWYTDDIQVSRKDRRTGCPNVGAFASWLDNKYEEFLLEQSDPDAGCVKPTPTKVLESNHFVCPASNTQEEMSHSDVCNADCAKKNQFGRHKSPKRKRKAHAYRNGEPGTGTEGERQSMEFIMPPKEISRAASDCCRATPPTSCSEKLRGEGKSQSLTSVTADKNRIDMDELKQPVPFDKPPMEQKSEVLHRNDSNKEIKWEKVTLNNTSCQCLVKHEDAQTQYETSQRLISDGGSTASNNSQHASKRKSSITKSLRRSSGDSGKEKKGNNASCQCHGITKDDGVQCRTEIKDAALQPQEKCLNCHCPDCCNKLMYGSQIRSQISQSQQLPSQNVIITTPFIPNELIVGKCSAKCPFMTKGSCTRNQGTDYVHKNNMEAQTSDMCFNLDCNTTHGTPLYVKIVCPEKHDNRAVLVT